MKRKGGAQAPDLKVELAAGFPDRAVAGVDEVGRGCLAGPVIVGAVLLPDGYDWDLQRGWIAEVRDSKLVAPEDRERLAPLIRDWVRAWAIGEASVDEIDRLNIYHATHLAMERAVAAVEGRGHRVGLALIDGNAAPKGLLGRAQTEVKGDLRCLSIAMASLLAKVHRDDLMREAAIRYPGYGFEVHKGYSTPRHQRAIRELGATDYHRRGFAPVRTALARVEGGGLVGATPALSLGDEERFS